MDRRVCVRVCEQGLKHGRWIHLILNGFLHVAANIIYGQTQHVDGSLKQHKLESNGFSKSG